MAASIGARRPPAARPAAVRRAALLGAAILANASAGCAGTVPLRAYAASVSAAWLITAGRPAPFFAESSSVVIPSAMGMLACPQGRAFLTFSDYNGGSNTLAFSRSLDCLNDPACFVDATREFGAGSGVDRRGVYSLPLDPSPLPNGRCPQNLPPDRVTVRPSFLHSGAGTDQLLVRVPLMGPGGAKAVRVVQLWQGVMESAPPAPLVDTLRWRDGQPEPPAQCNLPWQREGLFARHSDDCGMTWSEPAIADFAVLPKADGTSYGEDRVEKGRMSPRGPGVVFGTDRPEIYVDPFSPSAPIFVTADVSLPSGRWDFMLRSMDGGSSFQTIQNFPNFAGGPKVMTSTSSGRLFMARCIGGQDPAGRFITRPELSWFDDQGARLVGAAYVGYVQNGVNLECSGVSPPKLLGGIQNIGDLSISRVSQSARGYDEVRVAYSSALDGGAHQATSVITVRVSRESRCRGLPAVMPAGCVEVANSRLITPEPGMNVLHSHFAQSDGVDGTDDMDTAVLSYLTWPGVGAPATATSRFLVVQSESAWTTQDTLLSTWTPVVGGHHFIGDYDYGSLYTDVDPSGQRRLQYFGQWGESLPGVSAATQAMRARAVTLLR